METLDLHPEELFDKAAKGVASPDELSRIDAHLASCATCRFERMVRADFDAVAGSADDLDDLVARALSGAQSAPQPAAQQGPPRRRRMGPLLVAAIATMGFASFAAVAQFTGVLPRLITQLTTRPDAPAPQPTPAPKRAAPAPAPAPEPKVEPPVIEAPVSPAPVTVVVPRPRVTPSAPAPLPVAPREVEPTPELPEPDALLLFSNAQRARVQGNTGAAIRDFRVVVARFPNAPEAALAHAELGRLLLDRGEAASALESFEAYLASHDQVLREDVEGARAMALQALGRADAERRAWEAVLRDYPTGVYAPRARARLEALAP